MEYLLLIGPLIFYSFKSLREYGSYTLLEFKRFSIVKCIGSLLFAIHILLLILNGKYWFFSGGFRDRGMITTMLMPGVGYSFIVFSFVVSNSAFDSVRERVAEISIVLSGAMLVSIGYIYIFIFRLSKLG